jgi:hypothetical protein
MACGSRARFRRDERHKAERHPGKSYCIRPHAPPAKTLTGTAKHEGSSERQDGHRPPMGVVMWVRGWWKRIALHQSLIDAIPGDWDDPDESQDEEPVLPLGATGISPGLRQECCSQTGQGHHNEQWIDLACHPSYVVRISDDRGGGEHSHCDGQKSSSAGRTRTYNQWINSPLLYQLSYRGRMPTGMVRVPVGVPLLRASLRVDGAQTLGHGRQPGCSNVATGVDHTDSLIR